MSVSFNKKLFWSRLNLFYTAWRASEEKVYDSFVLINGKPNEDVVYMKTWAVHLWLCGYELAETVFVFTENALYVVSSPKKINLFESLGEKQDGISLHLIAKQKDDAPAVYAKAIDAIKKSYGGKKIGMLTKEKHSGSFVDEFMGEIKKIEPEMSIEDGTQSISDLLSVKDQDEQAKLKVASDITSSVLKEFLIPQIEDIIEKEEKITHIALAEKTEELMSKPEKLAKVLKSKQPTDDVESCYTPIIMSGGNFDLKPSAQSDESLINYSGVVIVSLGARYSSYCSNISRTLIIDASDDQKKAYRTLEKVYNACLSAFKVGAKLSDVYKTAIKYLRTKEPDLEKHFVKNCGFSLGIDFRDSNYLLNAANTRKFSPGMIFNFSVGFDKLEKKGKGSGEKTYALFIADTVMITAADPVVLTKYPFEFSDISYEMEGGDEDDVIDLSSGLPLSLAEMEAGPRTRGSRNKRATDEEAQAAAEKRKLEQKNLAKKKREEALKQFAATQISNHFDNRRERTEVINSYSDPGKFPEDSSPSQLYVDVPNESILLPINGQLIPFHIDLVKNMSKTEQGDFTVLRINFISPDMQSQTLKLPPYADRNGVYIRELSYKAVDPRNLNRVFRLIKDLQKRIKQRETEIAEESSLIVQEDLILHKDKKIVPRLRDLQVRPKLPGKKNNSGTLEAHVNGLRYVASNGIKIDVLYSNIKHAFFQPCEGTVSVIIHFELKHPIKVEKKKTNYVQVYVDVIEASQDLTQRQKVGDIDGLQEEQEERIRRKRWNERFKNFVKEVEDNVQKHASSNAFEFDIPYRDLMFQGVPGKTSVQILPTLNCLIALEDNPPWVLSLDEVEVAYFERVQLSLKNFDLVFVYKNFERPVEKIRSIDTRSLDTIQSYLNESEVLYFVGSVNLQWPRILKEIMKDPKEFYDMGGWESVLGEGDDDDDDEEMESEFEIDESAGEEEEDSDEYESEDEGGDDDDGDEEFDDEDEDEEALSWEELEERARESDRKRGKFDEEEEDRHSKKKKSRH